MIRAIGKYSRDFIAIIVLFAIAAGIGGYILSQQRFRFPFFSSTPIKLKANFSTAQAVTPGQGQTVRVSGVRIGDISAVKLSGGLAQVTMDIDSKYKGLVHQDATAFLRPKTGLKDMFVELNPGTAGSPAAPGGYTIPVQNTLPDVNPDEILASLDTDTRDYLQLLVSGAGQGLANNGHVLQAVFQKFLPTHRDLARVNVALATRHANLSRLVRSLNLLNTALAQRGPEISQLIRSSADVFGAFASQQGNIQRAVGDLPGTLQQTTQTLGKVQTFADVLGPTATNLRPAVRALNVANAALIPFAKQTTPVIQKQIRTFVTDARPLVRNLQPAAQNLAKATPDLTSSFVVLNHLFNLIGYNKSGPNAPVTDPNRDEGYLFWLAWLNHNAASVFGNSDANGTLRALTQESNCSTLRSLVQGPTANITQANMFLTGLLDILLNPTICGSGQP